MDNGQEGGHYELHLSVRERCHNGVCPISFPICDRAVWGRPWAYCEKTDRLGDVDPAIDLITACVNPNSLTKVFHFWTEAFEIPTEPVQAPLLGQSIRPRGPLQILRFQGTPFHLITQNPAAKEKKSRIHVEHLQVFT